MVQSVKGSKASIPRCCRNVGVGVSGFREEEFRETRSRPELSVFRALEGSSVSGLSQSIRIKWCKAGNASVVNGDPLGGEDFAVGMQRLISSSGSDVSINIVSMEFDGIVGCSLVQHLKNLELAAESQVADLVRDETVNKAVGLAHIFSA